jgi:hypothetical protein
MQYSENPQFNAFVNGYVTCMLWSTTGTDNATGEEVDDLLAFELAAETVEQVKLDCFKFCKEADHLLTQVYLWPSHYDSAGHDFWLTRAGHGAGFWDRGFGLVGDALTDRAKEFKECSPYVGDDGKVYI